MNYLTTKGNGFYFIVTVYIIISELIMMFHFVPSIYPDGIDIFKLIVLIITAPFFLFVIIALYIFKFILNITQSDILQNIKWW